jgi:hypothetical protein
MSLETYIILYETLRGVFRMELSITESEAGEREINESTMSWSCTRRGADIGQESSVFRA